MAEDKQATPEQQLLKLIEGQQKGGGTAASEKSSGVKRPGAPSFISKISGAFLGSFSFWKRKSKKKTHRKHLSFGIAEVNKILMGVTVLLAVYVVFDAVASARNLQRPPNFAPPKEMRTALKKEAAAPLEETSYYLQKMSSRDIFQEGKKEEKPKDEGPAQVVATETAEAIQNLALVGISWSSNPDAIIEDKGHQKTFFVKRGQMVGDDVKVEAIFKDHVVVTYDDKEYELR